MPSPFPRLRMCAIGRGKCPEKIFPPFLSLASPSRLTHVRTRVRFSSCVHMRQVKCTRTQTLARSRPPGSIGLPHILQFWRDSKTRVDGFSWPERTKVLNIVFYHTSESDIRTYFVRKLNFALDIPLSSHIFNYKVYHVRQ